MDAVGEALGVWSGPERGIESCARNGIPAGDVTVESGTAGRALSALALEFEPAVSAARVRVRAGDARAGGCGARGDGAVGDERGAENVVRAADVAVERVAAGRRGQAVASRAARAEHEPCGQSAASEGGAAGGTAVEPGGGEAPRRERKRMGPRDQVRRLPGQRSELTYRAHARFLQHYYRRVARMWESGGRREASPWGRGCLRRYRGVWRPVVRFQ